jgi:acid phosphatase
MQNTLVVLTFDEDETYPEANRVFTVLLGGAIPTSLHGTTDNTFYNHYSMLSTISLNWGLPSLGRWDCNANVLQLVANKTGYKNAIVDTTKLYFNTSYPGPLSNKAYIPTWPIPATNAKCAAGSILASVVNIWGKSDGTYNYSNVYPYDAANGNNIGGSVNATSVSGSMPASSTTTGKSAGSSPTINPQFLFGLMICALIFAL